MFEEKSARIRNFVALHPNVSVVISQITGFCLAILLYDDMVKFGLLPARWLVIMLIIAQFIFWGYVGNKKK